MSEQYFRGILFAMQLQQNVSLRDYSTMRLGGQTAYLTSIASTEELIEALAWASERQLPVLMIGGGSNIIWRDEGFPGLLLVNGIKKYEDFNEDEVNHFVTIGAGENWDEVVARTVAAGLTGVEALSLIPGTAGATPVQNVGAYGQEITDTLISVEAYDTLEKKLVNIANADCAFGYRTSRFKTTDKGRFFITAITLHLQKGKPQPPFYAGVQSYFDAHNITDITPQILRDAVIAIRSAKLPDPAKVANNGSFFGNPIISTALLAQLVAEHGDIPHWDVDNTHAKIPAAWLVEHAGFKDFHDPETGMATWANQPLVFVNERAQSTAGLLRFRQKVVDTVQAKFGITLAQEPELLP